MKIWSSINLPWGHKKFGPDRFSRFDVYWIQTNRQAKFIYRSKDINKFTVAGNHKCKDTDSINSVQSSLKSRPLWVTIYILYNTWCPAKGTVDVILSCLPLVESVPQQYLMAMDVHSVGSFSYLFSSRVKIWQPVRKTIAFKIVYS